MSDSLKIVSQLRRRKLSQGSRCSFFGRLSRSDTPLANDAHKTPETIPRSSQDRYGSFGGRPRPGPPVARPTTLPPRSSEALAAASVRDWWQSAQRVSVEERGKRDRDVGVGWRACVSKTAVPPGIAAIWFYDPG
jgi:hypothetical protein